MSRFAATTVALLTPAGQGAVATTAVQGPAAISAVEQCFRSMSGRKLQLVKPGHLVFGCWKSTSEELLTCPIDSTHVEVYSHGGVAAAEAIAHDLERVGCQQVTWQEALMGQAESWLSAEIGCQLCHAPTRRVAGLLLEQARGRLTSGLTDLLLAVSAGRLRQAGSQLDELLQFGELAERLTAPWKLAIVGQPNVGKSSLLNRLAGYARAIVHERAGTTRDVLTAGSSIAGWPVQFADTAGLRNTSDSIEAEGVLRARHQLAQADLLLLVFDSSQRWSPADQKLVATAVRRRHLIIHNKCDLPGHPETRPAGLRLSCQTGEGLPELIQQVGATLVPALPEKDKSLPVSAEMARRLSRARTALSDGEPETAREILAAMLAKSDGGYP